VSVDAIGLGKGVADALHLDFGTCSEYRASAVPEDPVQFANLKAEGSWKMRALLEKGLLRLPNDPMVRAQFLGMKYEITVQGRLRVVDPNDSPDRHDAIVIALTAPVSWDGPIAMVGERTVYAGDSDGEGPGDSSSDTSGDW
jgi:hypothetical protein